MILHSSIPTCTLKVVRLFEIWIEELEVVDELLPDNSIDYSARNMHPGGEWLTYSKKKNFDNFNKITSKTNIIEFFIIPTLWIQNIVESLYRQKTTNLNNIVRTLEEEWFFVRSWISDLVICSDFKAVLMKIYEMRASCSFFHATELDVDASYCFRT